MNYNFPGLQISILQFPDYTLELDLSYFPMLLLTHLFSVDIVLQGIAMNPSAAATLLMVSVWGCGPFTILILIIFFFLFLLILVLILVFILILFFLTLKRTVFPNRGERRKVLIVEQRGAPMTPDTHSSVTAVSLRRQRGSVRVCEGEGVWMRVCAGITGGAATATGAQRLRLRHSARTQPLPTCPSESVDILIRQLAFWAMLHARVSVH